VNVQAFLNTISTRSFSLPIVILYVTEGCNLRCLTCSYREKLPNELSLEEISTLVDSLSAYGLRTIVYSGGEPLMRRDFPEICSIFRKYNVKQVLLTNGLLLEKRLDEVKKFFSEIIVSIDGATDETHNTIRGVESLQQISRGIKHALASSSRPSISIRTVLQKANFRQTIDIVQFAKSLGVDRISFLAADVLSDSFGRATRGAVSPNESLMLNEEEIVEFRRIVEQMVSQCSNEFINGFISDSPDRMFHIVQYFEALIGKAAFPHNYCNAPMVSAVITSTGDVQPCYFLPAYGNIRETDVDVLTTSSIVRSVRRDVKNYTLERCKTCVCTLYTQPLSALLDRF